MLDSILKLTGDTVALRPWCESDAESLVRYANNRKIWRNMRDLFPHPYTTDDARAWFARCRQVDPDLFGLAIEKDGEAIGGVGCTMQSDVHAKTAEVGYWLGEPFWGRGIATEALRLMTDYAFAKYPLARLQACVFAWNPASGRVLEKAGYSFEARLKDSVFKDGELTDQLIYAKVCRGD